MITITFPSPPPAQPMPPIQLGEKYVLLLKADLTTPAWSWEMGPSGLFNGKKYANYRTALSDNSWQPMVTHTIDPITAVLLGLVTIEELQGSLPDGFIALLNLLNPK